MLLYSLVLWLLVCEASSVLMIGSVEDIDAAYVGIKVQNIEKFTFAGENVMTSILMKVAYFEYSGQFWMSKR